MGSKKLKFSVFTVDSIVSDVSDLRIADDMTNALRHMARVRDRMMRLSEDDEKDSDFISDYKARPNGFLFGSFLRLKGGSESFLSVEDLDKDVIEINDVVREASEKSAGTVRDSVFFALRGRYLVMTSVHSNKKALLNYLRWVARENGTSSDFVFNPVYNSTTEIPMKEIRSIKLADSYINSALQTKSFNLKNTLLKQLFSDVDSIGRCDWEDIVSATLTIKINKKELEKQNALNTALRLVDSEDVIITGRNGKKLRGSSYLLNVSRSIESTGKGLYNVPEIEGVMYDIIRDVEAGKMVD